MIGTAEALRTSSITSMPLRSGRPRSRMMRSNASWSIRFSAIVAVPASATSNFCGTSVVFSRRRICGSSSTTRILGGLADMGFYSGHWLWNRLGLGQPDGEDRAGPVLPVGGGDGAAHRGHETAADRQAEAGAGAGPVLCLKPGE